MYSLQTCIGSFGPFLSTRYSLFCSCEGHGESRQLNFFFISPLLFEKKRASKNTK
jgi:hypothetical protein